MEEFSGIAIDGSGRIYGVKTSDGGLYTIDKKILLSGKTF